jgi:beta-glucanase (GH16 family)
MPNYTFYDDFDGAAGSAPDPTKWAYDLGTGSNGWGNRELQVYTDTRANSYVDGNSNLVIAALSDGKGGYTSARLNTRGLFSQVCGTFEARIKLVSQPGIWPAFWTMGQDKPTAGWPACGEVDILEDFGANVIHSTIHAPNGSITYNGPSFTLPGDASWHVYRASVSAEGVSFFRDGYEHGHISAASCPPGSWVFGPQEPNNGGLFFILNVAVGGNAVTSPPPATTKFPALMYVDYVRAWV